MQTLQRLLIPALDLCTEVGLYLRLSGPATLDVANRHILLRAGGEVRTDTYFGVVSVGLWRGRTSVEQLALRLDAMGSFDVEAVVNGDDGQFVVAAAQLDDERSTLDLPPFATLPDGLVSFRIRCSSPHGRRRAEVVTADEATRPVHLGVAITTFNRMPFVASNVVRLSTLFKELPQLAKTVEVIIVDNGSNRELPVPRSAPLEIVANPNLGGAGGFAAACSSIADVVGRRTCCSWTATSCSSRRSSPARSS